MKHSYTTASNGVTGYVSTAPLSSVGYNLNFEHGINGYGSPSGITSDAPLGLVPWVQKYYEPLDMHYIESGNSNYTY